MNRRELLGLAGGIAGFTALPRARKRRERRANDQPEYYDPAKLRHAGVSSWSFRNFFSSTRAPGSRLSGPMLTLLDFPRRIADRYQIRQVEFASLHFASSGQDYLAQLRRQIERAHSRLVNVAVSAPELHAGGGLSDRTASTRSQAIGVVKQWIDVAHAVRAGSISVDPGLINASDISPTVNSFRELSAYGQRRRVDVLIEKRQGEEPGEVIDVIRQARSRSLGSLPDFLTFPNPGARARALELLFPYALTLCHANGVSFDEVGNETSFDFKECIEIAKRARFRGIYSVEFDGPGDPYQGVQDVLNELVRYL